MRKFFQMIMGEILGHFLLQRFHDKSVGRSCATLVKQSPIGNLIGQGVFERIFQFREKICSRREIRRPVDA